MMLYMNWIEVLTIIGTLGTFALWMGSKLDREIKIQSARADKLYEIFMAESKERHEMFRTEVKERHEMFVELLKNKNTP